MNKKILVIGKNGQLAKEIQEAAKANNEFIFNFKSRADLDITVPQSINAINYYSLIINCSAYTAVDKAEEEISQSNVLNGQAVGSLAKRCKELNIPLVHISTDFVFSGDSSTPYREESETKPISQYGKSKLAGEKLIQESGCSGIILRTSWLYSQHGANFVKTMLELFHKRDSLSVVFDQVGTPTSARSLAQSILKIIDENDLNYFKGEVFHYSNEGVCSWYDFANEIRRITKSNCIITPIHSHEYPKPAKRPPFSVLDKTKIKNTFGLKISHWADELSFILGEQFL